MTEEQVLVGIAMVSAASIICVLSAKVIDHKAKMKWVDYDAGEDCYEDEHKGHWEMIK